MKTVPLNDAAASILGGIIKHSPIVAVYARLLGTLLTLTWHFKIVSCGGGGGGGGGEEERNTSASERPNMFTNFTSNPRQLEPLNGGEEMKYSYESRQTYAFKNGNITHYQLQNSTRILPWMRIRVEFVNNLEILFVTKQHCKIFSVPRWNYDVSTKFRCLKRLDSHQTKPHKLLDDFTYEGGLINT